MPIFARYFIMLKKILFITIICTTGTTNGQINEVGISMGGSNYIGDIGRENYIYPNNYAIGVICKYNLNPRIALRGTYTYSKISNDDADSKNVARQIRDLHFTNTINELALGIEFNYFEYNLSARDKTHSPYILIEIAAYNFSVVKSEISPGQFEYESKTSYSLPFGLGYKTKIFGKIAGAFEIGVRYTMDDELDYNNHDIQGLNFGNPNNNDWYVFTGINLVYTFGRPSCYTNPL
jgi:hypothetical protein|tara:strand:+ start:48 stop:755 length:708 start_codon:yes stop_codon:yes gene_type:complete